MQGGMGAGVSDWRLAHAVSSQGELGVVSGTALDVILARRLQAGDPGGVLAAALLKRSNGVVDGFVVEGPVAGGHNAPPRGKPQWNDAAEPVYGDRDVVDLE